MLRDPLDARTETVPNAQNDSAIIAFMEGKVKKKFEVPGGCGTEELTRIDDLLRMVRRLPNADIKKAVKKAKEKRSQDIFR